MTWDLILAVCITRFIELVDPGDSMLWPTGMYTWRSGSRHLGRVAGAARRAARGTEDNITPCKAGEDRDCTALTPVRKEVNYQGFQWDCRRLGIGSVGPVKDDQKCFAKSVPAR